MMKTIMRKMTGLALAFALQAGLYGNQCEDQLFTTTVQGGTPLGAIVDRLAGECGFSVSYLGSGTMEKVEATRLGHAHVETYTLDEMLEFFIGRQNFHYRLEEGVLEIAWLQTRTFKVDYIDSQRSGNSNTDVSISGGVGNGGGSSGGGGGLTGGGVGGGGLSGGGANGGGSGNTGAFIESTETFNFWEDLKETLTRLLARPEDGEEEMGDGNIIIDPKSGLVTVSGTRRQLERVEGYIRRTMDSLRKQVLVDVRVISVILDDSHSVGIDWSKMDLSLEGSIQWDKSRNDLTVGDTTFNDTAGSLVVDGSVGFDLEGFFSFLRQHGKTRSLSNPKVLAINNQPTMISVGDNINYRVDTAVSSETTTSTGFTPQSIFVGVLLDITPQIDDDGYVTLRINPSISEFKYSEDAVKQEETRQLPPDTVTRRISSVVRMKDGDVVILGGLISSSKGNQDNKVPLLGDIPGLGRLFHSTAVTDVTTEIVFVLTPHVIDRATPPTLKSLGFAETAEGAPQPSPAPRDEGEEEPPATLKDL